MHIRIQHAQYRALLLHIIPLWLLLYTLPVWSQDCPEPCPSITLPWGTWKANSYNADNNFYTFQNIRFGQAPVGDLRFARSVTPAPISNPDEIQDNTYGPSCIAINPTDLNETCKSSSPVYLGLGPGTVYYKGDPNQNEDCLFLDLYVPKSALSGSPGNLPVVVWFYGGAFLFGSKSVPGSDGMLYGGAPFLQMAEEMKKEMIFVVGNYRLGGFGWLAGSYMESNGVPNAGLTDQQLLLQWVQQNIHLVGGDKTQVSAWGESAGGSSILHHLVVNNGQTDPLFQKAILQSAAYYWAWDRTGVLNDTYQAFAEQSGCPNHDIACLRAASVESLTTANKNIAIPNACAGKMPFGPAVDGILLKDMPPVSFQKGNYWRGIESMILSHVVHESDGFVPQNIKTEADFNNFIESIFPPSIAAEIEKSPLYSGYGLNGQRQRLIDVARDAFFTGNILQLFNAYKSTGKVYITEYAWPSAMFSKHARDLITTFYHSDYDLKAFLKFMRFPKLEIPFIVRFVKAFAPRYQQYFVSHAITGDPDELRWPSNDKYYTWNPAVLDSQGNMAQVAQSHTCFLTSCFTEITDQSVLTQARGNFWNDVAMALSGSGSSSGSSPSHLEAQVAWVAPDIEEEL